MNRVPLLESSIAMRWLLVAGLGVCTAIGAASADVAPADVAQRESLLALGQRIYREGTLASGEPLRSLGAAQMALSGKDAACVTCHRRSGYGSAEGRFVVRPITGPALLQTQHLPVHSPRIRARLGTSPRPPYDEALLARAIRSGVDAAGKPLDPVMPRYALSDREAQAVSAYLFSLSANPSPGVDDKEIHFATVIQSGVAPARKRAMLDVMNAFVKDKDANVRQDEARRDAGNMRMYRSYRKWVLHVWELSGPADTWPGQLDAFYQREPVFALIAGLGDDSWRAIHDFSERLELPCIFPQVDLPVVAGPNNYTVYFSRGVVLEAEVLAKYLREQDSAARLVQVFRRGDAVGEAAAGALRNGFSAAGAKVTVDEIVLDAVPDAGLWRRLRESGAQAAVLWLSAQDLAAAPVPEGTPLPALYLSSNRLSGRLPPALVASGVDWRLIYPSEAGPKREARLLRSKLWLHSKGIALTDETVQINTQFALGVVSDAVGHIMDSFSRDFFVERIEHVVGQTPTASVYQSVSLGPGQRFAAKGGSVVQVLDTGKGQIKAVSGWIVP